MKEFESTVGLQFQDPEIKVLYLKNQCLIGSPKQLVEELTEYSEVIARLKERYGKGSLMIECVIKDIDELRLNRNDEQGSIIKLCSILQSAWDDLAAVNCIEEFCNVITLTLSILEGKLTLIH